MSLVQQVRFWWCLYFGLSWTLSLRWVHVCLVSPQESLFPIKYTQLNDIKSFAILNIYIQNPFLHEELSWIQPSEKPHSLVLRTYHPYTDGLNAHVFEVLVSENTEVSYTQGVPIIFLEVKWTKKQKGLN